MLFMFSRSKLRPLKIAHGIFNTIHPITVKNHIKKENICMLNRIHDWTIICVCAHTFWKKKRDLISTKRLTFKPSSLHHIQSLLFGGTLTKKLPPHILLSMNT